PRTIVIVYSPGKDSIVQVVAEVLGKPWTTETSLATLARGSNAVVMGVLAQELPRGLGECDRAPLILINTHCVDDGSAPDENLTDLCDYEFLYSNSPFFRRDLTRF